MTEKKFSIFFNNFLTTDEECLSLSYLGYLPILKIQLKKGNIQSPIFKLRKVQSKFVN